MYKYDQITFNNGIISSANLIFDYPKNISEEFDGIPDINIVTSYKSPYKIRDEGDDDIMHEYVYFSLKGTYMYTIIYLIIY